MNRIKTGLYFLLATVVVVATASAQQNLDPVFQVVGVNGDCQVSLPGQNELLPAEESKAYPYGTRIRTGSRSGLVMTISEGNVVRVLGNADLYFNEDAGNTRIKNVRLLQGEVEVELNKDFHDAGNALNVETATAICSALGSHFRVASRMEQDLRIDIFRVIKGLIRVYGQNFDVVEMKADDWLSLLSPSDRSFLRLKNMKGAFDILIKDQDMNDKSMPTREGFVLKIWQQPILETGQRVVTAVLTSATGEMIETVTVTFGSAEELQDGGLEKIGWDEAVRPGKRLRDRDQNNPQPPDEWVDELVKEMINPNVEWREIKPQPPTPTRIGRR